MPDLGVIQKPGAADRVAARAAGRLWLRRAAREPLVQFLALGAVLFLVWPLLADRVAPPPNRIVISTGRMQRAVEIFDKTHARPPDAQELSDLAAQEVETEVYYREGIALGLDRDDEIIRRRLQQKLTFMIQDIVDQSPPSDADLQYFLDTHPAQFAEEPRIAFSQVYLNPQQHGASLDEDAARLLARLNASDGRLEYGADSDVLPVPNDFEATPLHEIGSMFGEDFAAAIAAQPAGRWLGPVRSGYGVHLVLVRQHVDGTKPKLADIHDAVLREWQSARRDAANADAYRQMRAKYSVQIDMPAAGPAVRAPWLPAVWMVLGLTLVGAPAVQAHEARPGYLELREGAPGRYEALWKQPANGEFALRMGPLFPSVCTVSANREQMLPGALVSRFSVGCPGGLQGRTVTIAGLEMTLTDVLVRLFHADGTQETHLARAVDTSVTFGGGQGLLTRVGIYLRLGVQHILTGIDHLLFVLGLVLIVRGKRDLLKTITAFTVAHSITLAAATLGYASVPGPPLSAAIALSILFLGPEILRARAGGTSLTLRQPWMVAFCFGLLHGFGFAGGLTAMGLPRAEIPLALLLFNVGVEIGQLGFVFLILALARAFRLMEIHWPRPIALLPAYTVGTLGAFWTLQRVAILVGAGG